MHGGCYIDPRGATAIHRLQVEVFQALASHPHRSHGLLEPFDELVVLDNAILVFVGLESEIKKSCVSACSSVEH